MSILEENFQGHRRKRGKERTAPYLTLPLSQICPACQGRPLDGLEYMHAEIGLDIRWNHGKWLVLWVKIGQLYFHLIFNML